MPTPGNRWYHVILSTKSTWLPATREAFATDTTASTPPATIRIHHPLTNTSGFSVTNQLRSAPAVRIAASSRATVGAALVRQFTNAGHCPIAVSISDTHVHLLLQLPDDRAAMRRIIGKCKNLSSFEVRDEQPGAGREAHR